MEETGKMEKKLSYLKGGAEWFVFTLKVEDITNALIIGMLTDSVRRGYGF